jgi:hypothetical protein
MQFDVTDSSAVATLAQNLATRARHIENQRTFIIAAMVRLGQTFQDEAYTDIKHSFERMSERIEDVLPQITALNAKLYNLYDNLMQAYNATN